MSNTLLTLTDVLRAINRTDTKDRSAIARYLGKPEVAALLGASGEARNVRYPEDRLWLFTDLMAAHDRDEVSPKSAVMYLRSRIEQGPVIDTDFVADDYAQDQGAVGEEDTDYRQPITDNRSMAGANGSAISQLAPITAQVERIGTTFAAAVVAEIRASGIVPTPEDKLIGLEEAAEMLHLSDRMHLVSRRVPPVLPKTWSRLQILRYIEKLRTAAEERAAAKKGRGR